VTNAARKTYNVADPTPPASGEGGHPMTDRLERIERRLDTIEGEQRTHFRWMITMFVGLGGLFVASTSLLMARIDRSEDRISKMETAISALPAQVNQNLMQLTQTLAQTILAAQRLAPPPQPPQDQR
jgi:hypothetical protein